MVNSLPALWILFAPLAAAVFIVLFMLRRPLPAAITAIAGILSSLAAVLWFFAGSLSGRVHLPFELRWNWLSAGSLSAEFGFVFDPLSILMLLVVTGVGSLIFIYSSGYMKGDSSFARFFASLSLFAFSMIGIVLSNNFLMLFVFWELVAVSSYLLIGFWFEKPSAADAGNKAFIVNRVADFGFLAGIVWLWFLVQRAGGEASFHFGAIEETLKAGVQNGTITPAALTVGALLVFCGVAGKSAQFPLYIWLPDAMEGPTPVSALIHAATMVAAGIYMLCRVFFLIELSPDAMRLIAVVGSLTAALAGGLAIVQRDIKKILAYSTVSQLGYMAAALGLGGATAGMYHLTTHAFFKALLFLGAGSMIHGLHTQDIFKMGGLLRQMPLTSWTFLIGTLALCGIWPLAGFFSKDEILALSFGSHPILFAAGLFTAGLTAFYMTRLIWVAVLSPGRSHHHAHESPWVMTLPLVLLSLMTIAGGFIGIPSWLAGHGEHGAHHAHPPVIVPILATGAALLGIGLGTALYRGLKGENDPLRKALGPLYPVLERKYFLDDVFAAAGNLFQNTAAGLLSWFDQRALIRGAVNGTAKLVRSAGGRLRKLQTGLLPDYALYFALGIAGLVLWISWGLQ